MPYPIRVMTLEEVALDDDPLDDIKSIKTTRWGIQGGKIYEPTELLNRTES